MSLHYQSLVQYRARLHSPYCAIYTYIGCHVTQGGQGKYIHESLSPSLVPFPLT
jgi:hypothetical protein